MPTVKDKLTGEVVAKLPYDATGEEQAEKLVEGSPNLEIDYAPGGETNAMDRAESYQLGGLIPGQLGFGKRPMVNQPASPLPNPGRMPGTAGYVYKEGGKTKKYKK
jgi:hypothetical protein